MTQDAERKAWYAVYRKASPEVKKQMRDAAASDNLSKWNAENDQEFQRIRAQNEDKT